MRLKTSFSAVGLFFLLTYTDSEWRAPVARLDRPQSFDAPLCTSSASLAENIRTYEFFGARAADAGSSLRQRLLVTSDYQGRERRFTGQTDWHIEWRACFEPRGSHCRIGGIVSTVNVTYTLPHWADREQAPPPLRERWDRYRLSLAAHEKGHGAIALEVARMIEAALVGRTDEASCETLNAETSRIVDEVMASGEAMQRDYDRATGHGSAQGALFPF